MELNIRIKASQTLRIAFENFIKLEGKLRQLLQKEKKQQPINEKDAFIAAGAVMV